MSQNFYEDIVSFYETKKKIMKNLYKSFSLEKNVLNSLLKYLGGSIHSHRDICVQKIKVKK